MRQAVCRTLPEDCSVYSLPVSIDREVSPRRRLLVAGVHRGTCCEVQGEDLPTPTRRESQSLPGTDQALIKLLPSNYYSAASQ
ncbi:hypothetical protein NDU88_003154 [Pleurodeles waltl]|uniref:Uncharacterized protein n=1 Tax=Pleurodeles waltl TaxID=8319 RepID=A0AAV7W3Y9_PLEWA|nr:hypothetical protein NDU88_003154 [Pleurodeles waltl]